MACQTERSHQARLLILALGAAALSLLSPFSWAQDNYEIQVYSYETVPPHHTMVELHSNFTFEGSKDVVEGMQPTEHALHETSEIGNQG